MRAHDHPNSCRQKVPRYNETFRDIQVVEHDSSNNDNSEGIDVAVV